MKTTAWLIKEGKTLLALFLYFLFCYGIFMLLKKLILAHYDISFFGYGAAIVGAFISAKAVIIIEKTPLSRVLGTAAPFLKIIYDCILYTVFALAFLYGEKVLELYFKEGNLRLAFVTARDENDLSRFCATVLWASLSFLGYAALSAFNRHLGDGELLRIIFTRPGNRNSPSAKG
jgi:hypothetical protein